MLQRPEDTIRFWFHDKPAHISHVPDLKHVTYWNQFVRVKSDFTAFRKTTIGVFYCEQQMCQKPNMLSILLLKHHVKPHMYYTFTHLSTSPKYVCPGVCCHVFARTHERVCVRVCTVCNNLWSPCAKFLFTAVVVSTALSLFISSSNLPLSRSSLQALKL